MLLGAEPLFIELKWWAAMLVIAGGVAIGGIGYAFLRAIAQSVGRAHADSVQQARAAELDAQPDLNPRHVPAGWYEHDPGRERYWDGRRWTDQYRDV